MRNAWSKWLIAVFAWLVVQSPNVTLACSVCSAGRDEQNQTAFLLSTVFMSVLPLVAIGTLVFVIWRRLQRAQANSHAPRRETI